VSSRAVEPPPEPEPDRSAIAGSGGWIGDAAGGRSAGVGLGSRLSCPSPTNATLPSCYLVWFDHIVPFACDVYPFLQQ
jgi:hypothetical protein